MNHVSENLKYLRAKKGLSQNELAIQLRLTRNQINSYENGNAQPSIDALQKISKYFSMSIDLLVQKKIDKSIWEEQGLK
jgi:transcriptional regulator with XRE-family HTH domain